MVQVPDEIRAKIEKICDELYDQQGCREFPRLKKVIAISSASLAHVSAVLTSWCFHEMRRRHAPEVIALLPAEPPRLTPARHARAHEAYKEVLTLSTPSRNSMAPLDVASELVFARNACEKLFTLAQAQAAQIDLLFKKVEALEGAQAQDSTVTERLTRH